MSLFGDACALTAAALAAAAIQARVPARTWLALVTIASCTPFSIWMIFSGWESGTVDAYSTAGLLAWLAGGVGVGASVLVGWAGAGETMERPA
ncbi:hypothetical protein FHR32_002666 [Streptosporangium album]|uniref:Uncharacterized protein n=1 Tax=Streptosporangium album TaxID=47479 RepID=A0A7W7RUB3_9ACTN|nr:hypothetical protein [Streptosporangium album]MBB4938361.1 hypothetical protein [Streptosporangium album]